MRTVFRGVGSTITSKPVNPRLEIPVLKATIKLQNLETFINAAKAEQGMVANAQMSFSNHTAHYSGGKVVGYHMDVTFTNGKNKKTETVLFDTLGHIQGTPSAPFLPVLGGTLTQSLKLDVVNRALKLAIEHELARHDL